MFVYLNSPSLLLLAFGLLLVSILIAVASYDIRHMVIPHEFVFIVLGCAFLYVGYEAYALNTFSFLIPHVLSSVSAFLFFYALWFVSKGRWIGKGDSKLALPLALMLVPYETFSFIVLSFWVGALISVLLLGLQKFLASGQKHLPFMGGGLTMKSEVPFAPFMLIAFILVFFAQTNVFALMLYFMP